MDDKSKVRAIMIYAMLPSVNQQIGRYRDFTHMHRCIIHS